MGIISDVKAAINIAKIKKGGIAKLSTSQITGLIVNLPDAQKKLSQNEFNEVYSLFKELRTCKTKIEMNIDGYLKQAIKIIKLFDAIAPYEKYSGGNELEFSFFMDDLRAEEFSSNMSNEKCFDDSDVDEYARYLMEGATFPMEYEDAFNFSKLLHKYIIVGKETTLKEFDAFTASFFERYGTVSPVAVTNIAYFTGALNANGIISDEELNSMNSNLMNKVMNNLEKK